MKISTQQILIQDSDSRFGFIPSLTSETGKIYLLGKQSLKLLKLGRAAFYNADVVDEVRILHKCIGVNNTLFKILIKKRLISKNTESLVIVSEVGFYKLALMSKSEYAFMLIDRAVDKICNLEIKPVKKLINRPSKVEKELIN